jgi:hypothetical protein
MDFIEGSRAFDITWGTVTGCLCLLVAAPTLWWILPKHARSIFPESIDPQRRLQFGWGIFGMFMAFTNFGCRFIDHRYLEGVHEGFFAITLIVLAVLAPLVVRAIRRQPALAASNATQCAAPSEALSA